MNEEMGVCIAETLDNILFLKASIPFKVVDLVD